MAQKQHTTMMEDTARQQRRPWRHDDDEAGLSLTSSSSSEDTYVSVVADDDDAPLLREQSKRTSNNNNNNNNEIKSSGIDNLSHKATFALIASALVVVSLAFLRSAGSASSGIEHHLNSIAPGPRHGHSFGMGELTNLAQEQVQYDATSSTSASSSSTNAVRSLSPQNILNLNGHYLHDEHRSPYASPLYDAPEGDLKSIQEAYIKKMKKVRKEWGAWSFVDPAEDVYGPKGKDRPVTDFNGVPYKDLPSKRFVDGSWQTDKAYVLEFIVEARKLVSRVKEAIYAEYGHPAQTKDGKSLSADQLAKREKLFRLITKEFNLCHGKPIPLDGIDKCSKNLTPLPGIGFWRQEAFDELAKKLLHAMMTHDDFYVVLGGHSSAAGHGNNFLQSKMMEFHYIMEPVLAKLGVRLVSRNMAMGGVGTLGSAMAGADIYGEADIMIWDSQMTEREKGVHDLFNRQAILSGERVPVLLQPNTYDIEEQSENTYVWGRGDTISIRSDFDTGLLQKTVDEEQAQGLPYAVRYMGCESGSDGLCKDHIYNSECWVRRSDYNPPKKLKLEKHVGGRASWHPGNRVHQLIGRKWSLIVLYALEKALKDWESGIEAGGMPLPEKYWHVGPEYEKIRAKLRSHVPSGEDEVSHCEEHFSKFPIVCRVAMHGFTEWTPRALPVERSLRAILKKGSNGYVPLFDDKNAYDGPDIRPPKWQIPGGEIDVHAVAIATNFPPDDDIASSRSTSERNQSLRKLFQARPLQKQHNTGALGNSGSSENLDRLRQKFIHFDLDEDSRLLPVIPNKSNEKRHLAADASKENEIIPGDGWAYSGGRAGFCDGSFQAECRREGDSTCPMSGHSDGRSGLIGDALSGWLVFELPRIKEGVIIARLEVWHGGSKVDRTEGWTEINNGGRGYLSDEPKGENDTQEPQGRRLNIPENDFYFDISINGDIKTMDYEEFMSHKPKYGQNMSFWPLLLPKDGETFDGPVELAIRLRSTAGRDATVLISHIYYA